MATTHPTAVKTAAPPSPAGLSHKQIQTILIGLMFGMLLAALDQTIVSTAIRTIGDELHGLNIQAWVTTAYLITSTVSTPLYGKLSDIYGRRPLFITAISLFIIGSFASSFSTSMYELAGFRAFQGLGAGGLFSLAFAILADIVAPRERAKYQGYFLAVFGTSSVIGPLVGGLLAGTSSILGITGWRWVFLVNVPIGAVALVVVAKVLHIPFVRRDHRIDWWGALALIVGIVPLLVVAEQGSSWGWASARILGLIAVALVGIAVFIRVELRMGDDALIPMRLFRSATFSLGLGVNTLIGLGMFGAISMLPLYLQLVKGVSPTKSGLLLLPLMLGLMAGSITSGQLTSRTGKYKIFPVMGTAILVVAFLLLLTVKTTSGYGQLDVYFLLIGLGLGLCMQTLLIAVQNAVPARDIGVATSSATFFRQLGGTLGVAIFLALLFDEIPGKIQTAIVANESNPAFRQALVASGHADPASAQQYLGGLGGQMLTDSSFLTKIDKAIALPFQQGFVSATHTVYLLAACAMVVAFVLINLIKAAPLRTTSALEERQVEAASMAAETLPEGGVATPGASPAADLTKAGEPLAQSDTGQLDQREEVGQTDGPADDAMGAPLHDEKDDEKDSAQLNGEMVPLRLNGSTAATPVEPRLLSNAALLSGTVFGPARQPIAGAVLTALDPTGGEVLRTTTDHAGAYRLQFPSGGTFLVVVSTTGHEPAVSTVSLAEGQLERNFALDATGSVAGYVRDAAGRPRGGVSVTIIDARGEVVAVAVTGPDGSYLLTDLNPGDYTLTAISVGSKPAAYGVQLTNAGRTEVDIDLPATSALSGVVTSRSTGLAVPDAAVALLDSHGMVLSTVLADDHGRYVFDAVTPGDYTVVASGYAPTGRTVRVDAAAGDDLELRLGHETDVDDALPAGRHSYDETMNTTSTGR